MHFKIFSVLLLSATAFATAEPEQKRNIIEDKISSVIGDAVTNVEDVFTEIGGAVTDIADLGKSLTSLLPSATVFPKDVWSSIKDQELVTKFESSLSSALNDNKTPDWYKELPSDARSILSNAIAEVTEELGPSPTGTATADTAGEPTPTGAASRLNGAVMFSVAGAAGILGLAVAL